MDRTIAEFKLEDGSDITVLFEVPPPSIDSALEEVSLDAGRMVYQATQTLGQAPHWRQAPWRKKQALNDPSSNWLVANLANRAVAGMLGGWKRSFSSEGIKHSPQPDIWRDRTLQRAFQLMGGVPNIQLQPTQPSLSPQTLAELADLVALPAATRAA